MPKKVHRDLRVTGPLMRGDDVEAALNAAAARARARDEDVPDLGRKYTTEARAFVRRVVYLMGGSVKHFDEVGLTEWYQRIIRLERKRPPVWLARAAARKRKRAKTAKPRIVTARQLGLAFQSLWGGKGPLDSIAAHYDAAPRVHSDTELIARARSIHRYHLSISYGGASYEALVAGDTIVFLNPMSRKSAAVAGQNTGLASVCVPGTTGDRMDPATRRTVAWLIDNWHTRKVPAEHRLPRPARSVPRRGHKEFPGQSTSCPGDYLPDYRKAWA